MSEAGARKRNPERAQRVEGSYAAIVTGQTTVQGTYDNQPVDIVVQFTDTFIRQNGIWKLAAGHVSRLKNTPTTKP